MTTESEIYKKLGPHPRLLKIIDWNPEECVLTMEYMPHGCLKDYLSTYNDKIPTRQWPGKNSRDAAAPSEKWYFPTSRLSGRDRQGIKGPIVAESTGGSTNEPRNITPSFSPSTFAEKFNPNGHIEDFNFKDQKASESQFAGRPFAILIRVLRPYLDAAI